MADAERVHGEPAAPRGGAGRAVVGVAVEVGQPGGMTSPSSPSVQVSTCTVVAARTWWAIVEPARQRLVVGVGVDEEQA